MLATGQKSYNCQEDSRFPVADTYLYFREYIVYCQEGTDMIERICLVCNQNFITQDCYLKRGGGKYCSRKCSAESAKGRKAWNKGIVGFLAGENHPMYNKHHSEESRNKMSVSRKGRTPWNKGIPQTEETKRKMSESMKGEKGSFFGKKHSEESKRKNAEAHIGKHVSEETRKKLSECGKGRPMPPDMKRKLFAIHKGRKRSDETRKKMSNACIGKRSGSMNPRWLGGISYLPYCHKFNHKLKERIRDRDKRTCQLCGLKENGRRLSVHHIHYDKPNCNPDLITLCMRCNIKVNDNRDYWEAYFMNLLLKEK